MDSEIFANPNKYSLYRHDRKAKKGGGVLIAIKKGLAPFLVNTDSCLEIVWAACTTSTAKVLVGVCYRPPDSNSSFIDELRSSITSAIGKYPADITYLVGDFNFPQIDWSQLSSSCQNATELINLTLDFNFFQAINQPTRGTNILDLVFCNAPESIGDVLYLDGFSDHRLIQLQLTIPLAFQGSTITQIRDYNRANYKDMNIALNKFFVRTFLPSFFDRTVEQNWVLFKNVLTNLVHRYVPVVSISNDKTNPWFNKHLNRHRNKKKRLYRKAKLAPTSSAWKKYRECLKSYCCAVRTSKKKYFSQDLPSLLKSNPKKFWRVVSPNSISNHISLCDDKQQPLDDSECPHVFNRYFASVFTREDHSNIPIVPDHDYQYMSAIDVSAEGVANLIGNLKISTSAGVDNINSKILKNTVLISSKILCYIFQQSLSSGLLPTDWKIAKVIPIFKSGNKNSPHNYRPISLTCICCKLLEHIIASHIYAHLEHNSFFFPQQHGFRKGLSCDTQLLEFTTDLHSNMDANLQTDCIFLDFAKAFDCVAHSRLFSKLSALCLDSLTLSWLRNFLSFRQQFTSANSFTSSLCDVTSGVPQGSVLGPLLFLIYINDLPTGISSNLRLFADDCIIYRSIKSTEDHLVLQNDLILIAKWCDKWQMSLNSTKCKVITFSRKRINSDFSYLIDSTLVSQASSYKYLGVHLKHNLSWDMHINTITAKASRSLGYLRRNLWNSPSSLRQLTYETIVRPQLEYASPVWSPHQIYLTNKLESVQNRAARFITSNYSPHSSITQIKHDIPLVPLNVRRSISLLSLFHKYRYSIRPSPLPLEAPSRISRRLHNQYSIKRISGRTNTFNSSALPRAIVLWNDLPDNIASISNHQAFLDQLRKHFLK